MSARTFTRRRVPGFALIPALFLIVVLGALAVVAIRVGTGQQHAVTMSLQEARALAAARAGIEWGVYRALDGTLPAASRCVASTTLGLSEAALSGFSVVISCSASSYSSGATTNSSYVINASATSGIYGNPAYVHRAVSGTFTDAT